MNSKLPLKVPTQTKQKETPTAMVAGIVLAGLIIFTPLLLAAKDKKDKNKSVEHAKD